MACFADSMDSCFLYWVCLVPLVSGSWHGWGQFNAGVDDKVRLEPLVFIGVESGWRQSEAASQPSLTAQAGGWARKPYRRMQSACVTKYPKSGSIPAQSAPRYVSMCVTKHRKSGSIICHSSQSAPTYVSMRVTKHHNRGFTTFGQPSQLCALSQRRHLWRMFCLGFFKAANCNFYLLLRPYLGTYCSGLDRQKQDPAFCVLCSLTLFW